VKRPILLLVALALALALALAFASYAGAIEAERTTALPARSQSVLRYFPDGRVAFPKSYREWTYVTSGADMTYSPGGMAMDHHMIDNVFVNPDAYRAFESTGRWPDGTVFAREDREARTKGSIARGGLFQTETLEGVELHVKDASRFKGGWAFFAFGNHDLAPAIPASASCYTCHSSHGAVDTTFVQFYPTLISVATAHRTLSAAYLRETRAP